MAMPFSFDTYIAHFLQTEGRCALPQWGVLRLVKQAAQWQQDVLLAPQSRIEWEENKQTSNLWLSRLANETNIELSTLENSYNEWLKHVQQAIIVTNEYNLAQLGTWQAQNNTIRWNTSNLFDAGPPVAWPSGLQLPANTNEPVEPKVEPVEDDTISQEPTSSNNLIYIAIGLLVLMLAAGFYWFNQNNSNTETIDSSQQEITTPPPTATTPADSIPANNTDTVSSNSPITSTSVGDSNRYDVVVYSYSNEQRAQKQVNKFVRNGNDSRVVRSADSQYLVVIRAVTMQPDTQRVVDSIRSFFYPKGRLYILK